MSRSRLLRGLGALVVSVALVLSGSLSAQADSPTIIATGAYGDCPVQLWSDGTLEFTCTVLNGGVGWTGELANWRSRDKVTSIKSDAIVAKGSLEALFDFMPNLVDIDALAKWDTSSVTNMFGMFMGAQSLSNIDALANWDTSKVVSDDEFMDGIEQMFVSASSLKEASFSNPNGFSHSDMPLEFAPDSHYSDMWERIEISNGAKPNLVLPENMQWINVTRGDGKKVSSAVMTTQIKEGKGEGVWKCDRIPVASITITGPSTIKAGRTSTLKATILPANATAKGYVWKSSDSEIANVEQDGRVTFRKTGVVTISALAKDGSGVSGSLVITVKPKIRNGVELSVVAMGTIGDCPVTLWDDGTLEFTGDKISGFFDENGGSVPAYTFSVTGEIADISPYSYEWVLVKDEYKKQVKRIESGPIVLSGALSGLFGGFENLEDISDLDKWTLVKPSASDLMYVEDDYLEISLNSLFAGASSLKNIDALANWDTTGWAVYGVFTNATSLEEATFTNPKAFAVPQSLDLTASNKWKRITIGPKAVPNVVLPKGMKWVNETRGDNKQVSSADMTAQIKAGKGEGVWKRVVVSDPSPSASPSVKPSPTSSPKPSVSPKPSASPTPSVKPSSSVSPQPSVVPTPSASPKPSASGSPSGDVCASGESRVMYRMYNRVSQEHLYTADAHERDVLSRGDWTYEGVAWVSPVKSDTPVYRLYNPILGDHHYTTDTHERDVLVAYHNWVFEGVGWYSDDCKNVPVYRQFTPLLRVGSHNYTADKNEYDTLNATGVWKAEGEAWYAIKWR